MDQLFFRFFREQTSGENSDSPWLKSSLITCDFIFIYLFFHLLKVNGEVWSSAAENHPSVQRLSAHRLRTTSLWTPRRSGEEARLVSDMAKEGADMTEETECMIDKNVAKETENAEPTGDAKEMRAVILAGFGGLNKLRVTKKPMPEPQQGEVKIRVKAW